MCVKAPVLYFDLLTPKVLAHVIRNNTYSNWCRLSENVSPENVSQFLLLRCNLLYKNRTHIDKKKVQASVFIILPDKLQSH